MCACVLVDAVAIDDPANVNYVIAFDSSVHQSGLVKQLTFVHGHGRTNGGGLNEIYKNVMTSACCPRPSIS